MNEGAPEPLIQDFDSLGEPMVPLSGPEDYVGISSSDGHIRPYKEAKEQFERRYLEKLLKQAGGNIARAARLAGKYRTEVYGLIKKYELDPRQFKG